MRRLSLSAKLFVAALPLLVAVTALLALSIRDGVEEVNQARRGALLGSTWEPLIASIQAIEAEQRISDGGDQAAIVDARRATDSSMSDLRQVVRRIGDSNAMVVKIGLATGALSTGRVAVDSGDDFQVIAAVRAYDTAERELIGLGRLLPAEAGDAELGRTLLAVASLAATEQTANDVVQSIGDWPDVRRSGGRRASRIARRCDGRHRRRVRERRSRRLAGGVPRWPVGTPPRRFHEPPRRHRRRRRQRRLRDVRRDRVQRDRGGHRDHS